MKKVLQVFVVFPAMGLSVLLGSCKLPPPVCDCWTGENDRGTLFIRNYDGTKSDATSFLLDSLRMIINDKRALAVSFASSAADTGVSLTDTVIVAGDTTIFYASLHENVFNKLYYIGARLGDTLSLILFKDSETKGRAEFVTEYYSSHSLVWIDTVDSEGFTRLQILKGN